LWEVYKRYAKDKHCAGHEAAMVQVISKIGRIASGHGLHEDNYVDGAAYFGIAWECGQDSLGLKEATIAPAPLTFRDSSPSQNSYCSLCGALEGTKHSFTCPRAERSGRQK